LSLVAFMRKSASACAAFTPIVFSPRSTDVLDERGVNASEEGFDVCCRQRGKYTPSPSCKVLQLPIRSLAALLDCGICYPCQGRVHDQEERDDSATLFPACLHRSHNSPKPPGTHGSQRNTTQIQHNSWRTEMTRMTTVTRCLRMRAGHIQALLRRAPVYATRRPRSVRIQPR
jgi:hypothetical protein